MYSRRKNRKKKRVFCKIHASHRLDLEEKRQSLVVDRWLVKGRKKSTSHGCPSTRIRFCSGYSKVWRREVSEKRKGSRAIYRAWVWCQQSVRCPRGPFSWILNRCIISKFDTTCAIIFHSKFSLSEWSCASFEIRFVFQRPFQCILSNT